MAEHSKIEWTDATWNIITGCTVLSPGCAKCYAMKLAGTRLKHHPSRAGLTVDSKAGPVWTGEVRFNEAWLTQPLTWKRPRKIFVCAHGDLFHDGVSDDQLDRIFAVMALCPQHIFQVLTKRPERMRAYMTTPGRKGKIGYASVAISDMLAQAAKSCKARIPLDHFSRCFAGHGPFPNIWLGVSVEDQVRADERIPQLLATPAAVRWLSCEPLLGFVELGCIEAREAAHFGADMLDVAKGEGWIFDEDGELDKIVETPRIDWVVAGGESGRGARPMHPDWARSLRDQCAGGGVPFHFKQWGEWAPFAELPPKARGWRIVGDQGMAFVGKKASGRLLDGAQYDGMPA